SDVLEVTQAGRNCGYHWVTEQSRFHCSAPFSIVSILNPVRFISALCWTWTGRTRSIIPSGTWIRASSVATSVMPGSMTAIPLCERSLTVPETRWPCQDTIQGIKIRRRALDRPKRSPGRLVSDHPLDDIGYPIGSWWKQERCPLESIFIA